MGRLEKIKKRDRAVVTRTEKEDLPRNYGWLRVIIMIFSIIFILYFLFISNIFDVNNIEVSGYTYPEIVREEIGNQLDRSLFPKNILLFKARKFEEAFYGDSSIENIEIKKIYPSKIKVIIEESRPAIIWESAGDNYLIDERGEVIGLADEENLIRVSDASNIKVEVGKRVASPTFVKFIKMLGDDFERVTGTKISNITIYDILTDVHVLTSDGWTVYLDASKEPTAQLNNLSRVLAEVRKQNKKIQYIDLRTETKAYYK